MKTGGRRVAVTGLAWRTALGDSLDAVWSALLQGRTGLRELPFAGRLRNSLAAPVADDGRPAPTRLVEMAAATVRQALEMAGREPHDPDLQLVLATSLGAYLDDAGSRRSLSRWAYDVGDALRAAAPPIVVSTACSSGSDAIMVGAELVRAGARRCTVCGGVDVLTPSKRLAHSALGTMSPTLLRAFDLRHDGTLLGEGAGFLVLEPDTSDRRALAILRGAASANDASGMAGADTTGRSAAYAMERSLADAGVTPSAIGLLNAHGSGTLMNDTTECNAFASTFDGTTGPLVFATKGNFGHTLGATGAIEAIALVLGLRTGTVPPIAGLEQPLPDFPLPLAAGEPQACNARLGLSLTLGFGGFDTSLVFEAAS
jgi:3-oxoacyl-[acyl-carrier-protein] synthase II